MIASKIFCSWNAARERHWLDAWLTRFAKSDLPELQSFANGIEKGKAALGSITQPVSLQGIPLASSQSILRVLHGSSNRPDFFELGEVRGQLPDFCGELLTLFFPGCFFCGLRLASPKNCLSHLLARSPSQKTMVSSRRSEPAFSPVHEASEHAVRWNKRDRSYLRQAWLDVWLGRRIVCGLFS